MFLTILGLGIATVISLISIVTSGGAKWLKALLTVLTFSGFGMAVYSAKQENTEKVNASTEARNAKHELDNANSQLETLRSMVTLVNITVGDLAKLNDLSGGAKYYVRIAADKSREGLEPSLRAIEADFRGAKSSGMVSVRDPKAGSHNYELVFGQGLDMAAAEVFHRLATSHHLPPEGQIAYILPEPVASAALINVSK